MQKQIEDTDDRNSKKPINFRIHYENESKKQQKKQKILQHSNQANVIKENYNQLDAEQIKFIKDDHDKRYAVHQEKLEKRENEQSISSSEVDKYCGIQNTNHKSSQNANPNSSQNNNETSSSIKSMTEILPVSQYSDVKHDLDETNIENNCNPQGEEAVQEDHIKNKTNILFAQNFTDSQLQNQTNEPQNIVNISKINNQETSNFQISQQIVNSATEIAQYNDNQDSKNAQEIKQFNTQQTQNLDAQRTENPASVNNQIAQILGNIQRQNNQKDATNQTNNQQKKKLEKATQTDKRQDNSDVLEAVAEINQYLKDVSFSKQFDTSQKKLKIIIVKRLDQEVQK